MMPKTIAIDFGLKRTGLAITDENKIFAFGHDTVESKNLMDYLIRWVPKEKVDCIVLGFPTRLNNEDTHITQNVRMLHEALQKQFPELRIELIDERFTSKMASESLVTMGHKKKVKNDKGIIDSVSATLILQSFLEAEGGRHGSF
jgi:putative holliday junction resolvase